MSAPDRPEGSLRDKVSAWLHSQGYPLEFLAANAFRRGRFRVLQGFYVLDVQSGAPREVDVLAHATSDLEGSLLRITYVVECKYSKDKPWVVFTSPSGVMHPAACITQTVGSAAGEAILWTLAGDRQLQSLDTFRAPPRPGFGGRQVLSKAPDVFYAAIQSVVSASLALANDHDRVAASLDEKVRLAFIFLPVVVLDGHLFEAYFDSDTGQMVVEETEHVRIH